MTIDKKQTADRIFALMTAMNMSAPELAEALGISAMAVWKWINAKTLPSLENIAALCGIFGVEIGDIVVMKMKKAA